MQDDKEDWKEAAATMGDIYAQAHLTIAATWASNSDSGLFAPDPERYKARKLQNYELYVREKPGKFPFLVHARASKSFALLTRAWVYQERFLSPRMVHFCRDQVSYQYSYHLWVHGLLARETALGSIEGLSAREFRDGSALLFLLYKRTSA